MTIALSANACADSILAHAALRHLLRADRPEILTPDHRPALCVLIHSVAADICLRLMHLLSDCAIEDADDIIRLEFNTSLVSPDIKPPVLRRYLESAVTAGALAQAYSAVDVITSRTYAEEFDSLMKRCIDLALATPLTIRRHYF